MVSPFNFRIGLLDTFIFYLGYRVLQYRVVQTQEVQHHRRMPKSLDNSFPIVFGIGTELGIGGITPEQRTTVLQSE